MFKCAKCEIILWVCFDSILRWNQIRLTESNQHAPRRGFPLLGTRLVLLHLRLALARVAPLLLLLLTRALRRLLAPLLVSFSSLTLMRTDLRGRVAMARIAGWGRGPVEAEASRPRERVCMCWGGVGVELCHQFLIDPLRVNKISSLFIPRSPKKVLKCVLLRSPGEEPAAAATRSECCVRIIEASMLTALSMAGGGG